MSETQQRFQFRLRHLFLIVTGLCVFLAVAVVLPWLAFPFAFIFVVGSAMARISTRSRGLWILGPLFAWLGGLGGIVLTFSLLDALMWATPVWFLILPSLFGVFFGGWYGGWMERKESGI